MRIASWNVNSIRTRVTRTVEFLKRQDIDVLAMQEIKCRHDQFPFQAFSRAGYQVFVNGKNQWNGVAVASRVDAHLLGMQFSGPFPQPSFGDPPVIEPRVIGVRCAGIEIWSLYVPHGRALDDPHFQYKLQWLESLRSHVCQTLSQDSQALALYLGDFNIAPRDEDVWNLEEFSHATHVSQPERQAFAELLDPSCVREAVDLPDQDAPASSAAAAGLIEVTRQFAPGWTYWDYQRARWRRNQGMKIDFALASPAVAAQVNAALVDTDERDGDKPSDHAPVIVQL